MRRDFLAELQATPALVERILRELPPALDHPGPVVISTDAASVDLALIRALALTANGIPVTVELEAEYEAGKVSQG